LCCSTILLLAVASVSLVTAGDPPEGEGWISLFNGKDLTGWKEPQAKHIWSVIDGVIDCQPDATAKGDRNLWHTRELEDFELHVKWRIKEKKGIYNVPVVLPDGTYKRDENGEKIVHPQPGADSGIFLRGIGKAQVNIWCWPIGSGEVYGYRHNQNDPEVRAAVTPQVAADKPVGEWNTFRITMQGDRLTVVLNGKTVIDEARLPGVPEKGPIALQHHGGYNEKTDTWSGASSLVQFRNIRVREL